MQKKKGKSNKIQSDAMQNLYAKTGRETPQRSRKKYECSEKLQYLIYQANLAKNQPRISLEEISERGEIDLPLGLKISKFIFSRPKDIISFVLGSNEIKERERQDGFEYWFNNDGTALDKLTDLNAENEINDAEFEELYNSDSETIAEYLVSKDYYGDEYSYSDAEHNEDDFDDKPTDYSFLTKMGAYFNAYDRLHQVREFFLSIINLAKGIEKQTSLEEADTFAKQKQRIDSAKSIVNEIDSKRLREFILATSIKIDEKGCIHFSISEWAKILQGVDITRIRICEICEKIFWANRKDAFACSKQHAKVRQMRLLRQNWKEKGELYLKARRKKEGKKNGNL